MGEKQLNNLRKTTPRLLPIYAVWLLNNLFELEIHIGGAPKCTNNVALSI